MIGMVIFALIMITVLDSVANITIARTRSVNRITLLEELYFFSESLATRIKDGGTLDYEEYWNRKIVWTGITDGHYTLPTGYGNYGEGGVIGTANYGSGFYLCRSGDISAGGSRMGSGWCLTATMNNSNIVQSGKFQRYGEYALQYMDWNGNADNDAGDESVPGDGNIIGDEDDKDIGDGPEVLSWATPELYLYDPILKERTFFRWSYRPDPGNTSTCNITSGSGSLWTIQILKLKGYDIGLAHSAVATATGAFDGNLDSWVCHQDWPCSGWVSFIGYGNIPTSVDDGWINLFPDTINVKKVNFQIFPRKDPWRSWSAQDDLTTTGFVSPFIQPYVRVNLTLGLSWNRRKLIRNDDPTISVSTTISLASTDTSK